MNKALNLRGYSLVAGVLMCGSVWAANSSHFDQGLVHYSQGEFPQALQQFRQAVEAGEAGADYMLMKMNSEGHGGQDAGDSLRWAQQAANNGIAQAQYRLAQMYANGEGTAVDQPQAFRWYREAALQYHPLAIQQLARCYESGLGVAKDAKQAAHWYGIAAAELDVFAQKGDAGSQNRLAGLYEQGKGVKTNLDIAMTWYRKAAVQGLADAQFNLGRMLAYGEFETNRAEAVYWLQHAVNSGHQEAATMLVRLGKSGKSEVAFVD